jgi:hypothetical protein
MFVQLTRSLSRAAVTVTGTIKPTRCFSTKYVPVLLIGTLFLE